MTRPIIVIVDAETNETVEREMNDIEFAEYQDSIDRQNQAVLEREQQEATKLAQRQALLDKLGITEEEANLLLGGGQ